MLPPRIVITHRQLAVASLCVVALFGLRAMAQVTCSAPMGWRAPLTYFCADNPALASEVNNNTGQLVTWLEAKVGTVGQPISLANGSVTSANLVDDTVAAVDLAPGAVDTNALGASSVTAAKVAGRVAVYAVASACSGNGDITFSTSCGYGSPTCGTCSIGLANVPRFENCAGVCPACSTNPFASQPCTASNVLKGYLVGP